MAGYLLARAGVPVIVLEKHEDFFRDFRGDTIHPSSFELMYELGDLEEFLRQPHQEVRESARRQRWSACADRRLHEGTHALQIHRFHAAVGFSQFPFHARKTISEFSIADGARSDRSDVRTAARDRRARENSRGEMEIRADLIIGADGRHSIVQGERGWSDKISASRSMRSGFGFLRSRMILINPRLFSARQFIVFIDRGDYWQCGYVIPKGAFNESKHAVSATSKRNRSFAGFFGEPSQKSMNGPKSSC